jgi:LDH2 family malate/lactate/ureidoglycolate dehydrogenase
MANVYLVNPEKLKKCVSELFHKVGAPAGEAEIIADCLIEADLCGVESHGITRIGGYVQKMEKGGFAKAATLERIQESASTAYYDAHGSIGFVCSVRAMNTAIEKAGQTGVGVVSLRNSNHYGAAGYYTKMAARKKMIGFSCTNGPPAIAPWGSTQRFHGTNPFSLCFPTRNDPIVLDMATSVVARGKIMLAARKGDAIPLGWALDDKGNPTTDAHAALAGSVFPVGGVKGYIMAFAMDVLSAVLSGSFFGVQFADFDNPEKRQNVGQFFMALDIERFIGMDKFLDGIELLKSAIRSLPRKEGVDKIYMPGEPEFNKRSERLQKGIFVSGVVYADLKRLCDRYGVHFTIDT